MRNSKESLEPKASAPTAEKDKSVVSLANVQKHNFSPFMKEARVEVKGKKRYYSIGVRGDTVTDKEGEVKGFVEHKYVRLVDDSQFVKVFAGGIAAQYQLGRAGHSVLMYLVQVVQEYPGTDRIYLSFMDAMEEPFHIAKTTFYRGMAELIDRQFIAPSTRPNMFFLNPLMVFNGDRFRFVEEFVKASKATPEDKALAGDAPALGSEAVSKPARKKSSLSQKRQTALEKAGQQRIGDD